MRLMKALILVIAIIILLTAASQVRSQPQAEVSSIINVALSKAKTTAINAPSVNWDSVSVAMHEAAPGAKSVDALKKSFEILLTSLNDHGGVFFNPATMTAITSSADGTKQTLISGAMNPDLSKFEFAMLENNICYLRLPALASSSNVQQQAAEIRQAIDSLSKGNAMQWIVDLRYTTGGDTHTLLASVAPLLDEGLVATAVDQGGEITSMYTVHNGNLYVDQRAITRFPLWTKDLRKAKIAVLTSRHSSGAAEFLAMALNGRKNTKLFGEPTAGHLFGMTDLEISKNLIMRIADKRYVDRKGNDYSYQVKPDVVIDFVNTGNLSNDPAIAAATSWLTNVTESAIALGMK